MSKLEQGQTVRLDSTVKVYTSFTSAFKHFYFKNTVRNPEKPIILQDYKGEFFKIFAIGRSGRFADLVALEHKDGTQLLTDCSCVTLFKSRVEKPFNYNF